MNMKKTMAAIAAGAVAVSAMATTVSAINDGTYTYSLVKEDTPWINDSVADVTLQYKVNATIATTEAVPGDPASAVCDNADVLVTVPADAAAAEYTYDATATAWKDADGNAMPATITVDVATNSVTLVGGEKITVTAAGEDTPAETTGLPTAIKLNYPGSSIKTVNLKVEAIEQGLENNYTYSTDKNAANYVASLVNGELTFNGELDGYTGAVRITVTTVLNSAEWDTSYDKVNDKIDAGTINAAITGECTSVTPVVALDVSGNDSGSITVAKPFKTGIKNNTEILGYLDGKGYKNVKAVLNDAVANFDSVTFTFNTATQGIGYVVDKGENTNWKEVYTPGYDTWMNDVAGNYNAALMAAGADADKLIAIYTSLPGADMSYTKFDQHLYPSYYAPEATTWTGFAWEGYNLFEGALIVNENLTMSLAQTDYFDWDQTSLSFDWDSIMDAYAITDNDFATFLHSMKLATSNTWYWDNMVVECTAGAEEDASSDAGVDGDGETIDDEPADDEVIDEPAEEPAPEVDEPAEEPAPEVSNPTTGNASVALAVIPVALAAAAVVAKKRS